MELRAKKVKKTAHARGTAAKNGGYTLVEVILVLALAGLMVTSLSASFVQSVFIQKKLAGRLTAMVLGEGKLAELEQGSEPTNSGNFPKPYEKFTWVEQEETADDGTKVIHLTVEWRDLNVARSITLQGYRTQE